MRETNITVTIKGISVDEDGFKMESAQICSNIGLEHIKCLFSTQERIIGRLVTFAEKVLSNLPEIFKAKRGSEDVDI